MKLVRVWMLLLCACAVTLAHSPRLDSSPEDDDDSQQENWSGAISRGELLTFFRLLKVSDDQKPALTDLFTAYQNQLQTAQKKLSAYQESVQQKASEGDGEAWKEAAPVYEKYRKHVEKLKTVYFEDFKALLTTEQQEKWPRVERRLQRGEALRSVPQGPARVDLARVVEKVMRPDALPAEVELVLDQYEEEDDRVLAELAKFQKQMQERWAKQSEDDEKLSEEARDEIEVKYMKEQAELVRPIATLNNATIRKLLPVLPEDRRSRLEFEYYRSAAFSWDGGQSGFIRAAAKALALKDLTDVQRQAIRAAQAGYEADMLPAYREIAEKHAKMMENPTTEDVRSGFYDAETVQAVWEKRNKAEARAAASVRAVLTQSQMDALPPPLKNVKIEKPDFDE